MARRLFSDFRFWLVCVFVVGVGIYLPSLKGEAIWDDIPLISGQIPATQSIISAFEKPFGNYFRPLTSASFSIENALVHGKPLFYHATNVVLHGLTAVLVALLALAVTQRKLAGILAGVFFAVQPMQASAVAWIGGRTDALSAFFLSAFLLSLVRYHQTEKRPWLAGALMLYLLAALSKEQAAAILPAAPLSAFVFGSKGWSEFWRLTGMFGAAFLVYVGLWAVGGPIPHAGTGDPSSTILLVLRTAAHYTLAFICPNPQSQLTFTLHNMQGPIWVLVGSTAIVGGIFAIVKGWKVDRPLAWLGVCALLVYLPVSNCPPVPSFVVGPFRCAETGISVACLFGIGLEIAVCQKSLIWIFALGANLLTAAAVTCWAIQQWLSPLAFFTRLAENDPHFVIGVQLEAAYLNMNGRPADAEYETSNILVWVFNSAQWAKLIDQQKTAAITPEVRQRLRTNTGIPQVKELGGLIAIHAFAALGTGNIRQARLAAKDALVFLPNDRSLKALVEGLDRSDRK